MKILVIGSGGREHAIIRKLKENPEITQIFAMPGNGGISYDATCVAIGACDIAAAVEFATREGIDFCVVTPDDPLCLGMVDAMEAAGIACFGPTKKAAEIEGSKVFAKNLMMKHHIPTAQYRVFEDAAEAYTYVNGAALPLVVKADGLALGKGVLICHTCEEARQAVRDIMESHVFGASGNRIVVEEFLTGPEVSVLAFTDGETVVPMVSSMDHKRALDGNLGLNTGGMGTIAPNPHYTADIAKLCMDTIFLPTIRAMQSEGATFKGCLYFGLMLTDAGPRVIEYNCRFGDPETQVVLPLMQGDLLAAMRATRDGGLRDVAISFSEKSACCVILASGGYPEKYETGFAVTGLQNGQLAGGDRNTEIFHAGDKLGADGGLVTAGGRVLGVTAQAETLPQAINRAYEAAAQVQFQNMHYRRDIGAAAASSAG